MRRDDALTQVWLCAVCQPTRHSDVTLVPPLSLTTAAGRGNNEAEEALQSTSAAHNTPVGLVLLSIVPALSLVATCPILGPPHPRTSRVVRETRCAFTR